MVNAYLTKGFGGERLEKITSVNTVLEPNGYDDYIATCIAEWKIKNSGKYKVEPYDSVTYLHEELKYIVDFGDYSYFIEIVEENE